MHISLNKHICAYSVNMWIRACILCARVLHTLIWIWQIEMRGSMQWDACVRARVHVCICGWCVVCGLLDLLRHIWRTNMRNTSAFLKWIYYQALLFLSVSETCPPFPLCLSSFPFKSQWGRFRSFTANGCVVTLAFLEFICNPHDVVFTRCFMSKY